MSDEARFDQHSTESLAALAKVVALCLPDWPCGRTGCKHCRKNAKEAWNNALEQRDIEENMIWGFDA